MRTSSNYFNERACVVKNDTTCTNEYMNVWYMLRVYAHYMMYVYCPAVY